VPIKQLLEVNRSHLLLKGLRTKYQLRMLATTRLQLRARFLARITQLIKQRSPQVLLQFLVILYRLGL